MKRFFLSALLVLGALTAATAGDFGLPISLTKRPHQPVPHPTIPGDITFFIQ